MATGTARTSPASSPAAAPVQRRIVGVAPGARLIGLKVLDATGRRLHQRRHPRHRVRDREQGRARHRRHQPVARPPDLRAGGDRPAGPGRRARRARGHRRRGLGRQHRHESRRPMTSATRGITSPGNAPSALTVGAASTRRHATRGDDRVADYSSRGPTWYDGFAKPDSGRPGQALARSATGDLARSY